MQLFTNNAEALLAGAIDGTATALTVTDSAAADLFAQPSGRDSQLATMTHSSMPGVVEIVAVTHRSDVNFAVRRGQEGTLAQGWPAGTSFQARVTAEMLQSFVQMDPISQLARTSSVPGQGFAFEAPPTVLAPVFASQSGYKPIFQSGGIAVDTVAATFPVELGVAQTWSTLSYARGDVVKPTTPDGYQYWWDSAGASYASSGVEPAFNGPGVTPASDGFWVATEEPLEFTMRTRQLICVTEVGFIAKQVSATSSPSVSIGTFDAPTRFANNVALSQIVAGGWQVHRIPVAGGGTLTDELAFKLEAAATGGQFTGRFYWRGFHVDGAS